MPDLGGERVKYRLLALDVDGTLIGRDGLVSVDVIAAVADARAAGLAVCLATGRSYVETLPIWRQLNLAPPLEPLVLIGGALVAEPDSGRTLYQRAIPRELACRLDEALAASGHCAMAITDPWRTGVDYYLTDGADRDAVLKRWFSQMNVRVRRVRRLAEVAELPALLRISAVIEPEPGRVLAAALAEQFAGQLNVHCILAPNYGVTVVEAFALGADKFSAVRYVAQALPVSTARIAAVGDDVNDLALLRGVGLGVAMPSAPPAVVAATKLVARDGLAAFIRDLTGGRYDDRSGEES
jgi:Cof subfamily protein (haloacid dehalogenase superfamily)